MLERIGSLKGLVLKRIGLLKEKEYEKNERILQNMLAFVGSLNDKLAREAIPADPSVKNYSYTIVDERVYYRENSIMKPVDVSETMEQRMKGMVQIRDCEESLELFEDNEPIRKGKTISATLIPSTRKKPVIQPIGFFEVD